MKNLSLCVLSCLVFYCTASRLLSFSGLFASDQFGLSMNLGGDVNGDSLSDFILGAQTASPNNQMNAGQVYIVFGTIRTTSGFPSIGNLTTLNGSNGFIINGISPFDELGIVYANGDINGDSISDIWICSPYVTANGVSQSGQCYVIFGMNTTLSSFPSVFDLTTLNGSNGFTINGANMNGHLAFSGSTTGSINGDKFSDIILCMPQFNPNGVAGAGQCSVIFGRSAFPSVLNVSSLSGMNGFAINGINPNDELGYNVWCGGDVNDDGYSDILICAPQQTPGVLTSYVIFGMNTTLSSFPSVFNLTTLNGSNGFAIHSVGIVPVMGYPQCATSMGDVNGDSISDIVIGDPFASPNNLTHAGQCQIIYGKNTAVSPFPPSINVTSLNGSNGYVINGVNAGDKFGVALFTGGDVNGDSISDILIGVSGASPNNISMAGEVYVLFGQQNQTAVVNLVDLLNDNKEAQFVLSDRWVDFNQTFLLPLNDFLEISDVSDLYNSPTPTILLNNSAVLPGWINFTSPTPLQIQGVGIVVGAHNITITSMDTNGFQVVTTFTLHVQPVQRSFEISPGSSLVIHIPDPSGGQDSYSAKTDTGEALPSFLVFDSQNLTLSTDPNIVISKNQTVGVVVLGTDKSGNQKERYDYSLVFVGEGGSSDSGNSGSNINEGAIIGGVVGGVVFVVILIVVGLIIFFIWKKYVSAKSTNIDKSGSITF